MSVGLLLITHDGVGRALLDAATRMLGGRCPLPVVALPVGLEVDAAQLRTTALRHASDLDQGDGVLVLTDLYGSTPSNIAASLAAQNGVRVVAGLNLPMLVRVFNYATEDLASLAERALSGGSRGILQVAAGPPDAA